MKAFLLFCLALAVPYNARSQSAAIAESGTSVLENYRTRPLAFELNEGQTDPRVKFLTRRGGASLFLTSTEAVISLRETKSSTAPKVSSVGLKWVGAKASATVEGVNPLMATANYLVGGDPSKWRSGISTFAKVRYYDLYPGIDLVYYGEGGNLEYDLVLAPGADATRARMKISGASSLNIGDSGDLIVETGGEQIRFHKPVAYQANGPENDARQIVSAKFVRIGPQEVAFELGSYDHGRELIVDPQLTYSTYLGGKANDGGEKVVVDTNGNAYVIGLSSSPDFPLVGAYQNANGGTTNAVVTKLDTEAAGSASVIYSTYLGGSGTTIGRAIAVDSLGEAYIVGDTNSPNFPVTPGAFQTTCKLASSVCSTDVFATKLNASGTGLLYSTYLGGTGTEFGFAVALDSGGHIFIGANTGSADIPVTAGAYQTVFAGGGVQYGDGWIAKLDPGGQGTADLLYATYLGGSGSEQLYGLALDSTGAICVSGSTTSTNFPVSATAFSSTYSGTGPLTLGDAFVTRLNPGGQGTTDLRYSTYLGGANDDRAESIAVDASDKIYLTGLTGSSAFPITAGAFQTSFVTATCNSSVCYHAMVAKIDPTLSGAASLIYSSYLQGNTFELGHAITLDAAGMVYIGGETASTDFPLVNPVQNTCTAGCRPLPFTDGFISKFDLSKAGSAALLFSTYLGGSNVDTPWSIAVDSVGNAVIAGQTFSTDLPTLLPFQANCNTCVSFNSASRSGDVFVARVCITACPTGSPSAASLTFPSQALNTPSSSQAITFSNTGTGNLTVGAITVTGANASEFTQTNTCQAVVPGGASCQINVTFRPTSTGSRTATVRIVNNGGTNPQNITVTGIGLVPPTLATSFGAASIAYGASTTLSFTVTNPNSGSGLTNITFSDILPSGLIVGTPVGLNGSCGTVTANAGGGSVAMSGLNLAASGSCLFSVSVTGSAVGLQANTTSAISSAEGSAGAPASASITVTQASQTLTFAPIANVAVSTAPFTVSATASSGLTAGFTSTTPSICTVSGTTVTILTSGGCSITATQSGNASYSAATPVTQSFTVLFADVSSDDYFFAGVNLLAQKGITAGCGNNNYCPGQLVTRAQMAIFMVRAIQGGDGFTSSATPYFTDVPANAFGFRWIQRMKELGITAGCGGGNYCPDGAVTRDAMAVFIIRARLGLNLAGANPTFTFPSSPYFTDEPNSDAVFPWVQRLKAEAITGGCGATTYCPTASVTRGDMAIFIMRGAFNQLLPAGTAVLTQVIPTTLSRGSSATFTITGTNTHFVQGTTQLSPLPGITIGTLTVTSQTSLTVQLTAAGNATPQPYSLLAITGSEQAVLPNALTVQ